MFRYLPVCMGTSNMNFDFKVWFEVDFSYKLHIKTLDVTKIFLHVYGMKKSYIKHVLHTCRYIYRTLFKSYFS